MAKRTPPIRQGTSVSNADRQAALLALAESSKKYRGGGDNPPPDQTNQPEATPKVAKTTQPKKPKKQDVTKAKKPPSRPKPTETEKANAATAVSLRLRLTEQEIETINETATLLDVASDYVKRALLQETKDELSVCVTSASWKNYATAANLELASKPKTVEMLGRIDMTLSSEAVDALHSAANDPLGSFKVPGLAQPFVRAIMNAKLTEIKSRAMNL